MMQAPAVLKSKPSINNEEEGGGGGGNGGDGGIAKVVALMLRKE